MIFIRPIFGNKNCSTNFENCPVLYRADTIKSANLAKFYRRMIKAIKRKATRAVAIAKSNSDFKPFIFRQQLFRMYTLPSLTSNNTRSRTKWISPSKKEAIF